MDFTIAVCQKDLKKILTIKKELLVGALLLLIYQTNATNFLPSLITTSCFKVSILLKVS